MEIFLFGCKDTTLHVTKLLIKQGAIINLITINPEKGTEQKVAGYIDLNKFNNLFKSIYIAKRYDLQSPEDANYFSNLNTNLGFSIGWQRLIPENILKNFKIGVFGMHGSTKNLPFGRGRSPTAVIEVAIVLKKS